MDTNYEGLLEHVEAEHERRNRTYSRSDIVTNGDGTVTVYWSTNDDEETGYPGKYAQDTFQRKSLKAALQSAGYSTRNTIGGMERITTLNGENVDRATHETLMAGPENPEPKEYVVSITYVVSSFMTAQAVLERENERVKGQHTQAIIAVQEKEG